ncbi:MAG: ATP-dependent Clp protease ATP-binding subunit [Saccharofermentans sp.]|jgi:ATP-dependent Clp protease ATP-binding subunit ClpE|nr:ATP-dependent Clp protease ATP-binding subunit [Clostridiales bacterium]MCR5383179.1 ATP-dependent Clp protease ATP-binding subunit [Saccharofermentans sp.]
MAICSICKKRHAIVFTSRYENGNRIDEGFCLKCAYESGISGVTDMFKATGINADNIDEMSDKLEQLVSQNGFSADPTDFLKSLASGDEFGGLSYDGDDDDETYEFDEDSTPVSIADSDEPKDDKQGEDEEKEPGNFFDSLFGRRPGSQAGDDAQGKDSKDPRKARGKARLKYLNEFGTNLTERAAQGKIDRIIGRDKEIERCIQILNRRSKNNPVLIGAPGVGKTAVAQGLAVKIVEGTVPEKLLNMQVWQLDLPALVAGTQFRGQFESRIKGVINEAIRAENIILVIDELHTIIGAGDAEGSTNAANILKPALARGELRILGSTTTAEYKRIEKDSALERRFQKVMLDEPSVEMSIEILKGIKDYYEKHHNVTYSDEVIEFAVKASKRYITDRYLPDKAIDLIDEAGSAANLKNVKLVKLANTRKALEKAKREHQLQIDAMENSSPEEREADYEKVAELKAKADKLQNELDQLESDISPDPIQVEDIARVVEMWTGIPLKSISETETEKLRNLEERLHKRVVGQEEAVHAVASAVRRTRAGFTKKHKPTSFIFVGPTGVGKTELVKALAEVMFDTEEALIRIDMSEYMEPHSVSKLIGSPPGYVGFDDAGQLTEQVRRKPYSVILFDEVEKAHPDVFNLLLQMLDDGVLTDSHGLHVNFENCIIIMTSNAGSSAKAATIGFFNESHEAMEQHVQSALKETFRPEFLNRVDETIIFKSLKPEEIRKIVNIMIKDVFQSLDDKHIKGTISKAAGDRLAEIGYDEKYGARPLRKAIRTNVEDPLSDMFLTGALKDVVSLKIDYRRGKFVFDTIKKSE